MNHVGRLRSLGRNLKTDTRLWLCAALAATTCVGLVPTASAATDPVTGSQQLVYGGDYSDCFWHVGAIGVESYNIAYPDAGAHYWGAMYKPIPGMTLRIKGTFPYARYSSINSYDRLGSILDTISDFQWNPDAGSSNPFRPGVKRDVAKRSYTLTLASDWVGVPTADRRANLPARNTIHTAPLLGDTVQGVAIRVYVPNNGKDIRGGVPLPTAELTLANGTILTGQAACDALHSEDPELLDPSALLLSANQYNALRYQKKSNGSPKYASYFPALKGGKANWRTQYTRQYLLNLYHPEADPLQGAVKSGQSGFFPNGDNQYVRNAINRKLGQVYAMRGTLPTTAVTRNNPSGTWQNSNLRYLSFCMNESPRTTRVMDCVYDEEIPLRTGRKYLVVTSRAADRPSNATAACGVAWIEWSPRGDGDLDHDFGWMQIRNMLPAADFTHAIQNTKVPGDEKSTLGSYLPTSKYYKNKAAFQKLGCPAK